MAEISDEVFVMLQLTQYLKLSLDLSHRSTGGQFHFSYGDWYVVFVKALKYASPRLVQIFSWGVVG